MMAVVASFTNNQLSIVGDSAADTVAISTVDVGGVAQVTVNGQSVGAGVNAAAVTSIFANLGGGNDTMNLSSLDLTKFSGLSDGSIEIRGGTGNDTLVGSPLADILKGEDGNDSLTGGAGNDTLIGANGNDTLIGGAGDDTLDGGQGDDVYSFSGSSDLGSDTVIQAASGNLDTLGFGSFGGAIVIDIAMTTSQVVRAGQLTLTLSDGAGIDNVQGTAYDDVILGNAGGNSLMGNGGNDYLWGRGGNDWLDGGAGNDTLYGGDGNDTLLGKGGNDSLYGHAGDDTLNGNEGNDYLSGDDGDDTYIVTNYGTKTIAEASDTGSDSIQMSGEALNSDLDLHSTEAQIVAPSLSVRFTTPGGVNWRPGAGADDGPAAEGLYTNGYYTVPGVAGTYTLIEFTYGGDLAAYSNEFFVVSKNPDNGAVQREHLFTGKVASPGATKPRTYEAGTILSFELEQDGSDADIFYSDRELNDSDIAADSDKSHVKVLDLGPGEIQLSWEDLYYEKPNPSGYIQDTDFNDLWLSMKLAEYTFVDLDIDSDNNDRLEQPRRTSIEDGLEETQGKTLIENLGNTDNDEFLDFLDFDGIAGKRFVPLILEVPIGVPVSDIELEFDYLASDPNDTDNALFAIGAVRIWKRNASERRFQDSVSTGGSYVPPNVSLSATSLGITEFNRKVTLFVEGITASRFEVRDIKVYGRARSDLAGNDRVKVEVIQNQILIGIDGTSQDQWLTGGNAKRDNGLWNSHVRNLLDDAAQYMKTIYDLGVTEAWVGGDAEAIRNRVVAEAEEFIQDAGGGTNIALVGWSRGAMLALVAGNDLVTPGEEELSRFVSFVGLYDPVDMSPYIEGPAVDPNVAAVTIVGPDTAGGGGYYNVDYPHFVRMALLSIWGQQRIATSGDTEVERKFYNASHGAIGGTPGYNPDLQPTPLGGGYNYSNDVSHSIAADGDIRMGLRRAGFGYVPERESTWYGFPSDRPA